MGNSIYWHAVCHHPQDKAIATVVCFLAVVRAPQTGSRLTLSMPASQKARGTDHVSKLSGFCPSACQ